MAEHGGEVPGADRITNFHKPARRGENGSGRLTASIRRQRLETNDYWAGIDEHGLPEILEQTGIRAATRRQRRENSCYRNGNPNSAAFHQFRALAAHGRFRLRDRRLREAEHRYVRPKG